MKKRTSVIKPSTETSRTDALEETYAPHKEEKEGRQEPEMPLTKDEAMCMRRGRDDAEAGAHKINVEANTFSTHEPYMSK